MPIALANDARAEAIASLQEYARAHFDRPLGDLAASALLDFVLEEIGPSVYNQAIADAQARMQERVQALDLDLHEEPFAYGRRNGWR